MHKFENTKTLIGNVEFGNVEFWKVELGNVKVGNAKLRIVEFAKI